jgi:HPt (histidine-containing phosphotransfer) domain-containing protein
MPAGPARLNTQALDNIRALSPAGGAALLARVLRAYLQDTPGQLQALGRAVAAADTDAIRKTAHSLKSSSANVGAEALAQLCRELEQLGRGGVSAGTAPLLAAAEREFQAVQPALAAILEKDS